MPTITVKNIPADLYTHLKQSAGLNRRSINSEIIVCIERTLRSRKISPETVLARARQLREKTRKHAITDADFTKAKGTGRRNSFVPTLPAVDRHVNLNCYTAPFEPLPYLR